MAVIPMRRVNICALQKDRKGILKTLQRLGVIQVSDIPINDSVFEKTDTSAQRATFEKNVSQCAEALEVIDSYVPEKKSLLSSLHGRQRLSEDEYETYANEHPEVMRVAYRLTALAKEIAEKKAENIKLSAQMEALTPWLSLPVSLRYQGSKTFYVFTGAIAGEQTLEAIYERLALRAPDLADMHIEIISKSKEQTCILAACHREDAALFEDALRAEGFARPASPPKLVPAEEKERIVKQIEDNKAAIRDAEEEICTYAGVRRALRFIMDYFTMRSEKYEALDSLLQSKHAFVLSGYIPAPAVETLEKTLTRDYEVDISVTEPDEDEEVPVLLKNNAFTAPVEGVLESFSLPGRGDIDPTSIMAIWYYVLFGLMFSDAGYGLLLVLGCSFALLKLKDMENSTKNTMRLFLYCGISTMFWGIVFSSYFGDALNIITKTFFGREIGIPPLWFSPLEEPMRMLMFSLAVGVVHLFSGLAAKLYALLKARQFKDALYDVVFWYLLVGGGIVFLLSTSVFIEIAQLDFILPSAVGTAGAVAAGIGAVGIVLTGGRESKNPVKRLLKGAYALYNVTGYLSDILSYSRLLALGLATGVIASVVNQMGAMGGKGPVGIILFILVFLIGQAINFGIELLGAYVHTNRLQFVEFFGKFYDGGGEKFKPFAVHTKFFKFKEDITNG